MKNRWDVSPPQIRRHSEGEEHSQPAHRASAESDPARSARSAFELVLQMRIVERKMSRFHALMQFSAGGIPELTEAPAPRTTAIGWSPRTAIERTSASRDSVTSPVGMICSKHPRVVMCNVLGHKSAVPSCLRSIKTTTGRISALSCCSRDLAEPRRVSVALPALPFPGDPLPPLMICDIAGRVPAMGSYRTRRRADIRRALRTSSFARQCRAKFA